MNNLEKIIRVITIPPIVTGITVLLLYFISHAMCFTDFLVAELCLLVIPSLAYPVSNIMHKSKDKRECQRNAAMIFSAAGYTIGFIWISVASKSIVMKVLFTAYIISIVMLLVLNKIVRFKASGHACSTTAPIVLLTWQIGLGALIPGFFLIGAVYYSSLKLKRHTLSQLITGSCVSLVAVIIGILIFAI